MKKTIGDRIIAEIIRQEMFTPYDWPDGSPLEHPLIFVWNANAADQLDALVAEYSAKRKARPKKSI